MSSLLQKAVDAVNSVAGTSFNIFSSFITFNYYIGDVIFACLQSICSICTSVLLSLFVAIRIMLEDLVVFLIELSETAASGYSLLEASLNIVFEFIINCFCYIISGIQNFGWSIASSFSLFYGKIISCISNIRFFFDLLGRSIILLCSLLPRTIYILYVSLGIFLKNCKDTGIQIWSGSGHVISNASPELVLGTAVGITSSILIFRLFSRIVRERGITLESAALSLFRLVCLAYVSIIRLVARVIHLIFTMVEMTISHLRVPMFAHAGDSDDEDEDRENLVGDIEDESEEERDKAERKRRNYQLMVKKAGQRRGSNASMEDQLLREVEREREDKLCVVCQDKEKCIMILPCRHLCICEGCQGPIRTHRNTCPICRRGVKQMIKAYL